MLNESASSKYEHLDTNCVYSNKLTQVDEDSQDYDALYSQHLELRLAMYGW
jgi:hypothetical protein